VCFWRKSFDSFWFNEFWWTITWLWSANEVFLLSPKSCSDPWSELGDRKLYYPELPRLHRYDRCSWPVWPVWALCGIFLGWVAGPVCFWVVLLLVSSWSVWSCFARFCEGFFFPAGCVVEVFLFQGLEKSLRLSGTFVVRVLLPLAWLALSTSVTVVTGLTGAGHRSDRCGTSNKPCKFPLCVLVSFGSEGCLLVPRISSTPVATWNWPTWVVESETCVGSRVHLVGASMSFEKNFYRLPFTPPPPLWFAISVLHPLSSNSCNWFFNSASSLGGIR
jgi:hypothetical protein